MSKLKNNDTNPGYWKDYSNLQFVKHGIIQNYLQGWYPILSSWQGEIMYLERHAGKGVYETGDSGSPIVALKTLLSHSAFDKIVNNCKVVFNFIEKDESNMSCLNGEICKLGELHRNIRINQVVGDSFSVLSDLLEKIKSSKQQLAPAFIFVDPYGFKIDGETLRELMQFEKVELFINIMWRELNMGISQPENESMKEVLNYVFGSDGWQNKINSNEVSLKLKETMDFIQEQFGVKWATYMRMLGKNNQTRYVLLHLTNNDRGRDLMKECMWKICPDGDFIAKKTDDIFQQSLFVMEPDWSLLQDWVIEKLAKQPMRWNQLIDEVRHEIWRDTHLNKIIRQFYKDKVIIASDYSGQFAKTDNPLLSLVKS